MMNAIFPVLLESALRALAGALVVWAALRLLGVRNVRTRKTAWTLMLAAALAMPLLMRWQWLPASDVIPAPRTLAPAFSSAIFGFRAVVLSADRIPALADAANPSTRPPMPPPFAWSVDPNADNSSNLFNQPRPAGGISIDPRDAQAAAPEPAPLPRALLAPSKALPASSLHLFDLAWAMYLAIAAALLLRLIIGVFSALRLWMTAGPVLAPIVADLVPACAVRCSPRVSSPANILSGILLPADYREWSGEKLRVVLAHEREHVRQGDFYLQLLAGLYAALVWFSPLGWWLKRELCELGEAMSDCAGVEEAVSPSSYAQMLLEFAALPRPIGTGVAMARSGRLASRHLADRIERLLNDSVFRQAFAAGGRRAVLALVIAPLALLASAALVRVQAASQSMAAQDGQARLAEASPQSGVSNPPAQAITGQDRQDQQDQQKPSPAPSPVPPNPAATPNPAPPAAQAPEPAPASAAGAAEGAGSGQGQGTGAGAVLPSAPSAPPAQGESPLPPIPPIYVNIPPMPNINADVGKVILQSDAMRKNFFFLSNGKNQFYFFDNGEPWALVPAQGEPIMNRHPLKDAYRAEIDKARRTAHAPFFWFRHRGKSYIVEDPSVVAQVETLEKPIEDLRSQMRALGSQQSQLGEQLRQQMHAQRPQSIPKPDLSKQMADLNAAVNSLKASQGDTITQDQLMKLQEQVAQLQGQLARAESGLYRQNGEWGTQMGVFGKQMGKLGAQQGRLAGEMGRMSMDSGAKIDDIIQQSLKDGKAKPQN